MRLSITARLCIFIMIASLIALLSMAFFSYWLLIKRYSFESSHFLHSEVLLIHQAMEQPNNQAMMSKLEVPSLTFSRRHMSRITSSSGELIYQTKNIPPIFLGLPLPSANIHQKYYTVRYKAQVYRVLSTHIDTPNRGALGVQVAYDITEQNAVLNAYLKQGLLGIGLVVLSLMLVTYVLVKLGLRPIKALSKEVTNIDIDKLDQRFSSDVADQDIKALVQAFNKLMTKIEKGYERLSQFSSNIAHELKTPLNTLMLGHESMLVNLPSHSTQRKIIASNLEELQRLASIVDKLLFIAKANAKSVFVEKETLSLAQQADEVLDLYLPCCEASHIVVSIKGDAYLKVDKMMLRTALSNLLSNAIRYGKQRIEILIEHTQDSIQIHVTDDGKGVDNQHIEKLTETFYRADNHRTKDSGGVGLGLSIVSSIMNIHGGKLILSNLHPIGFKATLCFADSNE